MIRLLAIPCVLILAVLMSGCSKRKAPSSATAPPPPVIDCGSLPAEAVLKNNRGVALMSQFQYSEAYKVFTELAEAYPGCPELVVNQAIAELNVSQKGEAALQLLAQVLAADPDHPRANYITALLHLHGGRAAEAVPFLERVAKSDPRDPFVALQLASAYEQTAPEKALDWHLKAVSLDPLFRTPYYRLFDLCRLKGQVDEARRYLDEFQRLKDHPRANGFEFKYTHMGPKAEAIRLDGAGAAPGPLPAGDTFAAPAPLIDPTTANWAMADTRPNLTVGDLDGTGRLLLFVAGAVESDGQRRNLALLRDVESPGGSETAATGGAAKPAEFQVVLDHPLAAVAEVNTALWGDFDNDGLTDVYLCRRGPNQLWRQKALHQWEDVTASSQTAGGDHNTIDGAFFDADHDGDLDLFLVQADGPSELLNNNLNGTFQPLPESSGLASIGPGVTGVVPADLDGDRDLDLIVLRAGGPHDVFWNDRVWAYRPAEGFDRFREAKITAAVVGDLDADGQVELYSAGPDGLARWRPNAERQWEPQVLNADVLNAGRPALALLDVNGDGRLELLGGGQEWTVFLIEGDKAAPGFRAGDASLASWTPVLLETARGPAIVGCRAGAEPIVWQPGPGRFPFLALFPSGKATGANQERSNASGIGAWVELRNGHTTTVLPAVRIHSGPGQSLQAIAVGLAGRPIADYARVRWSDGVWQAELDLASGARHRIEELNRIPTSCPILFAWNGERFQFVSDLLGVGGLGYFVEPGVYASSDPTECFLLPDGCLQEEGGLLKIKLSEPMEELTYLDHAALIAYDLPPGWQMTLDERMGINAPLPTGEPRFYRRALPPSKATNNRGDDVTNELSQRDHRVAPPGLLDPRFTGMLQQEHILTLTFDQSLEGEPREPILVADGWVEYPYSQTVFAAWQAGLRFHPPTLEARAPGGSWQTVLAEFGYPAGMPRQMSVPLGRLPEGTTELRLRTNQEIYWDRLTIAFAEPCPEAQRTPLEMVRAELGEGGFMHRIVYEHRRPDFDHSARIPLASTRDPAGLYTAFGRVEPLLRASDDAVVIFGPGEELSLTFQAPPAPPPAGWQRRFVLDVHGWCKDTDLYTQFGDTVEPLPRQADRRADSQRDALHGQFNTRYQAGQ